MISRGEVGLIVAGVAISAGAISQIDLLSYLGHDYNYNSFSAVAAAKSL